MEYEALPNAFNDQVIEEFRANRGRVGGPFEGGRLILLTTTGARSGAAHTTPVAYLHDGPGRLLVIASASGVPHHPAWFHNLVANPRVRVEHGPFTYEADAAVLDGAERDAAFARAAEADPGWEAYQAKTDRVIPVVALVQAGPPLNDMSPGAGLRIVHDVFRHELELIRKEAAAGGTRLGAQLRINCLTLCQGLHYHHTAEDDAIFPPLAEHRPDLAPVLVRLAEEHKKIAVLLEDLRRTVSADPALPPATVLAEVDGLIGELEAHLTYEEQQLIPILDA